MPTSKFKQRRGESKVQFAERMAEEARDAYGAVDFGNGPLCPSCAEFAPPDTRAAEILAECSACYNCEIARLVEPEEGWH